MDEDRKKKKKKKKKKKRGRRGSVAVVETTHGGKKKVSFSGGTAPTDGSTTATKQNSRLKNRRASTGIASKDIPAFMKPRAPTKADVSDRIAPTRISLAHFLPKSNTLPASVNNPPFCDIFIRLKLCAAFA